MQKKYLLLTMFFFIITGLPVMAEKSPEEIMNAIVKVKATIPQDARTARILGTERQGNGVVIDDKGNILTIGYLILEAETIEVTGAQGDPVKASFVAYDYKTGFGILRAEPPLPVKPIKLGQSSRLKEGDPILMIGFGGSEAVSGSRIVSLKEFAGYWEYLLEDAIYTNPPYPNYGGAALIDQKGELLGIGSIYTQLSVPGLGIIPCNMSVPIDLLKPILADLINTGRSSKPPQPWLGVHADEAHGRIFIIRVTAGGPAEKAGIKTGDIVLAVNQTPVKGLADFFRRIWALGPAGVKVPLKILQETRVRDITVQSADRYQFLQVSR
ncbi:MAG: S1C family serine protease [Desulfobacterales bacterium]|jgi:S1-C subfamily serine protease